MYELKVQPFHFARQNRKSLQLGSSIKLTIQLITTCTLTVTLKPQLALHNWSNMDAHDEMSEYVPLAHTESFPTEAHRTLLIVCKVTLEHQL